MLSIGYNQHLKFGYGPRLKSTRELSFFNVQVGLSKTPPLSFQAECLRAAKLIQEAAQDKRILVAMSGGLDSEVVARSFLAAGIHFEAVILRYVPDLNDHDISSAVHFCKMNNIKANFVDIDVLKYFETTSHVESYQKYNCNSPMFSVHLELCRQHEKDFLVYAGVVPLLHLPIDVHKQFLQTSRYSVIENTIKKFQLVEFPVENNFCFDFYFYLNGSRGVSNFYLYTPELVLSSLIEGNVFMQYKEIEFFSKKFPSSLFSSIQYYHTQKIRSEMKCMFFKRAGFPVQPRESKFNGFEKIHFLFGKDFQAHSEVSDAFQNYKIQFEGLLQFNKKIRSPMEKHLPKIKLGSFKIHEENTSWLLQEAVDRWTQERD